MSKDKKPKKAKQQRKPRRLTNEEIARLTIAHTWGRLQQKLVDAFPEEHKVYGDDTTDEQLTTFEIIQAIEEEWIIDPDTREANSLIRFED